MMHSRFAMAVVAALFTFSCSKTSEESLIQADEPQQKASDETSGMPSQRMDEVRAAPNRTQAQPMTADKPVPGFSDKTVALAPQKSFAAKQDADDKPEKANTMIGKINDQVTRTETPAQNAASATTSPTHEDLAQTRTALGAWSQEQIDHIDNAISDARAKSATATAQQKLEFERALRDVRARRAMVNREISRLPSQSGDEMAKFENRLHMDMNDLTARVDKMRNAM